jgi:hypothetical protein
MKRRLVPAMPDMHFSQPARSGMRSRALEHAVRIGQFALLIWLGVMGGRFLARGLIQSVESLMHMLS